jgi:hypothetical protein
MDRLVWAERDAGEPRFAADGTYVVVRVIRQHVEFWDRVGLLEQERMIGRERVSGAPLGGSGEFQDPDFASDPPRPPDPAVGPHPPRQPTHARHRRRAADPPQPQLRPRRRRRGQRRLRP